MELRHFAEVSVLHLEPETWTKLVEIAETQPRRPGGFTYDPEDPWHNIIADPLIYGCFVHTGAVEDELTDGLPASLVTVLREAFEAGASYVLFDTDLEPMLDLPVFEHPDAAR